MDYVGYTLLFRVNEEKVSSEELDSFASEIESDLRLQRPWETPQLDMKALPSVVPYKPGECDEHRVVCLRCEIFISLTQTGHDEMGILAANLLLGSVVNSRRDLIENISVYIKFHRVGSDPFSVTPHLNAPARHR
jgi:hypothetical protein